ncbi:hypothetical protein EZV73_16925 [Acidaminobacter sp. JC074]|uniref:hypothetical protein n=1 Tax=Acidaminobacter sp. JC074 TaxID=2530199 RepID=UPI001F106DC1|nr:hypothetical protein [Acidaminobacter sp. JC074]MCH4889283.1 hypothetical protein [Acidaminobacter sp. JC074]
MKNELANQVIEELIELSSTKLGFLKVGRDTLNIDILFIEKYATLKETLGSDLDTIDMTQFPKMKTLKNLIEEISSKEQPKERNVRMANATKAYRKK